MTTKTARRPCRPPERQRVDPDFLRGAIRAHFIIAEAQRYGVTFAIENGRLAIGYPLDIEARLWRQLQDAIRGNAQMVARYVHTRSRGLL